MRAVKAMILLLSLVLSTSQSLAADEFPLRAKYKDVPTITTEQLYRDYDDAVIVDVRSKFEYDVVHINGARFNPVSTVLFVSRLKKLRPLDSDKKLVFYCNGHTCSKSYKAARKAIEAGYKNVYAYDAGIFDWIKAHPEKGTLLKQSPVAVEKIIPVQQLRKHLLPYKEFVAKAKHADAVVIDVRDPFQRDIKLPLKSRNIHLDKLKSKLIIGLWKDKDLYIYDAVGKQVRWLQYYLEQHGYKNYYFLQKGATGASALIVKQ